MSAVISEYVRSCHDCQSRKVMGITSYPMPTGPFQVWQIDLYGPLPTSLSGSSYIFTAIDMFRKFICAIPLKNKDTLSVAHSLFYSFCIYGTCLKLLSDQGREFMSECMTTVCDLLNINQEFTPRYEHHCLGAVERTHRTLAERLTPLVSKGKSCEEVLPGVEFSMNCTPHAALKYSPFEILYGIRPTFPLAQSTQTQHMRSLPVDLDQYMKSMTSRVETIREEIKHHALKAAEKMLENANNAVNILDCQKGDYVYLQEDPTGGGKKLKPFYVGPYVFDSEHSKHLVIFRDPKDGKRFPRPIHKKRIKRANVRIPNPVPYLMDTVVTRQCDTTSFANLSGTEVQPKSENTRTNPDDIPLENNEVRRSTRKRQKPLKFRDGTYQLLASSESELNSGRVKRILAERNTHGTTEYIIHFVGESSQNARWVEKSKLNKNELRIIQNRPPPQI